ncbi:uncharacterized protein EI90DRAFT_3031711 [Cantharellus anzutake]|uniref:uncharacterized protein n=1 Tax=Cantharellus anzutake TaxID=1750568 RepID=UPI001907FC4C|nr:uncharacterized protein EI90DRAFT_3031711 [Cantharellus anzutake]KAF8341971.1 hypothetical protein EI90DRAFT_3031711 [Cantharellus anzutake]
MFLNFATTSFIATLLASVTAHPTANLIRELRDTRGLGDSNQGFAGALLSRTNYVSVTASFVIPEFGPTNLTADSVQYLNAVVILLCTHARVSAFVGFSINPNGTEVFALGPIPPAVSFIAGDMAQITVEALQVGYNTTVENLTSGHATSGHIPSAKEPLCFAASWGIEGPRSQSFVGSINFYNTFAVDKVGVKSGLLEASIQPIIAPNGTPLTSINIISPTNITSFTDIPSSTNMTISYL